MSTSIAYLMNNGVNTSELVVLKGDFLKNIVRQGWVKTVWRSSNMSFADMAAIVNLAKSKSFNMNSLHKNIVSKDGWNFLDSDEYFIVEVSENNNSGY